MTDLLKPLVRTILERATSYEWSEQGLGMYRLLLTPDKRVRLHVWDPRAAVLNVSTIHTHPWNFTSTVVAGHITDFVWSVEEPKDILQQGERKTWMRQAYRKQEIICGPGGCAVGDAPLVYTTSSALRTYQAGDTYRHRADTFHETMADPYTITIVEREFLNDTERAFVLYPDGGKWVSAEPRVALEKDVKKMAELALEKLTDAEEAERAAPLRKIEAPWSADQVTSLNAHQACGYWHPKVGAVITREGIMPAHGLECPGCLEEHTTRHQVPRDQHTCRYRTVQKIGDPAGVAGAPEQDAVAGKPTGRFVREVWYSDEQLAEAAAQRFAHNADPATRHGGQPVSETVVMALCDICEAPAYVTCSCQRCVSEPDDDERYHACNNHLDDVTAKHMRVRGLGTVWVRR
jgi:hypothetical protein